MKTFIIAIYQAKNESTVYVHNVFSDRISTVRNPFNALPYTSIDVLNEDIEMCKKINNHQHYMITILN